MIQTQDILAIAAVSLVLIAYIPYMVDIVRGKVAPHPFSWLVWAMTATAIFFLQTSGGSGAGAYATAVVAVCASLIFILSFKTNKVRIRPLDIVSLSLAVVGIIIWIFIDQPAVAIMTLLIVEVIGFIPTLLNGWRHPYKDSMAVWVANGSRHTLGFAAVQNYNFLTMLNPIVWITLCSIYVTTLAVRRRSFTKSPSRQRPIRPYN